MKSRTNRSRKTRKRKKFVPPPKRKGGTNNRPLSKKMKYGLIALGVVLFIALLILSVVISNLGISKGHTH
ncbi:hypothetical protein BEI02_05300 [Elizabethkingia sp. HvH-WGS333]|jgi:hypothetical protein|uniref:Uncharacterized protein n=2 Tax=Flavobacteriales TaxID=200644 RepID=A0A455ZCZ5_9FLAO|nr:hypothetical protein [Paenimyroides ceti]MDN3707960.1 hypothetical protein [Paenimyroides ceti]OIK45026.1 hypothetical protein BEI02_05300 [Elizabethkingia sp. HvH-WGS333]DAC74713.1 TPA_exp: hypothetical protein [Elizabethkingia anophelis]DAC74828.1 TPA_exp: hypothetical protein [Elizabethkingia anophelis]